MRAGDLDKRIDLLHKVVIGRTARAEPDVTWKLLATVWAQVKSGQDGSGAGNERDVAERTVGLVTTTFTMRYRSDITINSSIRVRYNGQIYNIISVAPGFARNDKLVLTGTTENV